LIKILGQLIGKGGQSDKNREHKNERTGGHGGHVGHEGKGQFIRGRGLGAGGS
jgi:hypothetical protein